jgi:transposase-like protein
MNIIEQGKRFLQSLRDLARRSVWEWRRCPHCGSDNTTRWGFYTRRPWSLDGQQLVSVPRHRCKECGRTYSEESPLLVVGSWYARDVHRFAIDHWQHLGTSLRRTAEMVRSWVGRQERYRLWRPLEESPGAAEECRLAASTVHRWLDRAGHEAQARLSGQLADVPCSGTVGIDGLWARLRGGAKRVVLLIVDSVSGVIWPPLVAEGEESETAWERLFERARQAGLELAQLRGVTSDGAQGALAYLRNQLGWVGRQRCVWHVWRNLARELRRAAAQAAEGLAEDVARQVREQVRGELVALVRAVVDAASYEIGEQALALLKEHPQAGQLWRILNEQLDRILIHLVPYYQGLQRVTPEWCWRDFRLRLSRGRNHGSDPRLERAALVWSIYRNFTPTQWRSERKRRYRHPGQSAFEVAGVPPGEVSYLDALRV